MNPTATYRFYNSLGQTLQWQEISMNPTAAHSNLLTHIHKIGLTHIYRFKKILLKKPNIKIVFQNEIVKESLMNLPMSDQLEHDFKTMY